MPLSTAEKTARMDACLRQMPRVLNANINGGYSASERRNKKLTESTEQYVFRPTPVNKDAHLRKDYIKQ